MIWGGGVLFYTDFHIFFIIILFAKPYLLLFYLMHYLINLQYLNLPSESYYQFILLLLKYWVFNIAYNKLYYSWGKDNEVIWDKRKETTRMKHIWARDTVVITEFNSRGLLSRTECPFYDKREHSFPPPLLYKIGFGALQLDV